VKAVNLSLRSESDAACRALRRQPLAGGEEKQESKNWYFHDCSFLLLLVGANYSIDAVVSLQEIIVVNASLVAVKF